MWGKSKSSKAWLPPLPSSDCVSMLSATIPYKCFLTVETQVPEVSLFLSVLIESFIPKTLPSSFSHPHLHSFFSEHLPSSELHFPADDSKAWSPGPDFIPVVSLGFRDFLYLGNPPSPLTQHPQNWTYSLPCIKNFSLPSYKVYNYLHSDTTFLPVFQAEKLERRAMFKLEMMVETTGCGDTVGLEKLQ